MAIGIGRHASIIPACNAVPTACNEEPQQHSVYKDLKSNTNSLHACVISRQPLRTASRHYYGSAFKKHIHPMAEAIGIAGSIVGMVAVTLHAAKKTCEFINSAKNAPIEVQALVNELQVLSGILEPLERCDSHGRRALRLIPTTDDVLLRLNSDLASLQTDLQRFLKTLEDANRATSKFDRMATRGRTQVKWPWNEKKTNSCLGTIGRLKIALGIALQM